MNFHSECIFCARKAWKGQFQNKAHERNYCQTVCSGIARNSTAIKCNVEHENKTRSHFLYYSKIWNGKNSQFEKRLTFEIDSFFHFNSTLAIAVFFLVFVKARTTVLEAIQKVKSVANQIKIFSNLITVSFLPFHVLP